MSDFTDDINLSISNLEKGNLILYPTDTIWGIGCDATNEEAVKKIYTLKQRDEQKSMIVLVKDIDMLLDYIENENINTIKEMIQKFSDRPTTIIYKKYKQLASNLSNDGSIAIRITNEKFTYNLIEKFEKPIVSTSANISGEATPMLFNEVSLSIKEGVDFIVKYRQEDLSTANPSRIISFENNTIKIIRD